MNISVWPLNEALVRLSELQGHYIRPEALETFDSQQEHDASNKSDTFSLVMNKWTMVHPEGQCRAFDISNDFVHSSVNLGGLWLQNSNHHISALIIRGYNSQEQLLIVEDSQLKHHEIKLHDIQPDDLLIQFSVTSSDEIESILNPKSASDWFKHVIAKRRNQIIDAVLATFFTNLLAIGIAMYTMQIYDRVIPSQSNSTLIVLTIGVLIAIALEVILKKLRARIMDSTFKDADLDLSKVFFSQALKIRLDARPQNVGTFISELRSYDTIRAFLTSATIFVLADAPFAIFFMLILIFIGGFIGLIPLLGLVALVFSGVFFARQIQAIGQNLVDENNRKNGYLIESMDGIESIKAASGEVQLTDRWAQICKSQNEKDLKIKDVQSLSSSITQAIQQISYISIVALGALLIHHGQLTMGGLIACTILSSRTLGPMLQMPMLLTQWSQLKHSLARLNQIMLMPIDENPTQIKISPKNLKNHLHLDRISFEYSQNLPSLMINKLDFKAGEIHLIIGKVGSGKSTLLKVLSGLYKPSVGRVLIDNIDLGHLSPNLLRRKIGYLPQDVRLIKGSLKENLMLGTPYASDAELLKTAEKVGLDILIKRHPEGLNLPIAEGGVGLSGGQKQMVALARLFLTDPQILLLDEPTSSLDTNLEFKIMSVLKNWMTEEKLIIAVTHKGNFMKIANNITILENGRILESGPKEKVIEFLKKNMAPQNQ